MKLEYSGQIFEKYSNFIKILQWDLFHCGRTDRRDETNIRFLQFCERAQKLSRGGYSCERVADNSGRSFLLQGNRKAPLREVFQSWWGLCV